MSLIEYSNIGKAIKILRRKKGYSQKEMANMLNIAPSTYSGYETNYRNPNSEMIDNIARILDIDSRELLFLGIGLSFKGEKSGVTIDIKFDNGLLNEILNSDTEDNL